MSSQNNNDDFFNDTGASLNRSGMRSIHQPPRQKDFNVTRQSIQQVLTLYNFEDEKFQDSSYVLTSPRSLDACSRLGIKPVELLHKPLLEFQEELEPKGVSLRTIYTVYDDHESERQAKLKNCREERERVIEEDIMKKNLYTSPVISRSLKSQEPPVTLSGKQFDYLVSSDEESFEIDDENKSLELADLADGIGQSQRKRTAWTTSIGHDRVSKDELNRRAKKLYEEGLKARQNLIKRQGVPKTANKEKKRKCKDQPGRSYSMSDLPRRSSLSRLTSEAATISDTKLRSKLRGSNKLNARINPKDHKILEIMMNKREEDRKLQAEREAAKRVWDEQKKVKEADKTKIDSRRRRSMTDLKSGSEKKSLDKPMRPSSICSKGAVLGMHEQRWNEQYQKQQQIREQQINERKLQEMERKKSQEMVLKSQEQEFQDFQKLVEEKLEHDIRKAAIRREAREHEDRLQRKLKNYQTKKRHEERMSKVKEQMKLEAEELQLAIESKHKEQYDKYLDIVQGREKALKTQQHTLEEKIRKSRKSKDQLDTEMEAWREELAQYRRAMEQKAAEEADKKILSKSKKAQEERLTKAQLHSANYKKLLEHEEEWKKEMENIIAHKNSKSSQLQNEREEQVQESRAMAHASQLLREELRQKYADRNFDEMNRQAQVEARVGTGVHSATKNMSTLVIS